MALKKIAMKNKKKHKLSSNNPKNPILKRNLK